MRSIFTDFKQYMIINACKYKLTKTCNAWLDGKVCTLLISAVIFKVMISFNIIFVAC